MTLIDSNILIDIWSKDPVWHDWSEGALRDCLLKGEIAINPIILAELALGFKTQADCETVILDSNLQCLDLPCRASFSASDAFKEYRQRGGSKSSTLPDFFIGAHAAELDIPLLTRDPSGYQSYFPKLKLITP